MLDLPEKCCPHARGHVFLVRMPYKLLFKTNSVQLFFFSKDLCIYLEYYVSNVMYISIVNSIDLLFGHCECVGLLH